jgi:phage replication O-like protein O
VANPQKENGHLDLANEIVEALAKIRLSGEETQCLWVILRKTYCWHKKEDKISLSQFSLATGLTRPSVARALKKLLTKKITEIIKNDNSYINIYRFNKDFDTWQPLTKKITVLTKKIIGVDNIDNGVLTKKYNTKETITKESNTKKEIEASVRFERPKPEQVREYALSIGYASLNPQAFIDHYEASGWIRGKTPIKDWKACVRTWFHKEQPTKPKEKPCGFK